MEKSNVKEIQAMTQHLLETWDIHNRVHLYLLTSIQEEHLSDDSSSHGRTVGDQFAHMHNVRLMWLKAANPDLLKDVSKIEKDTGLTRKLLSAALKESSEAIRVLLEKSFTVGSMKGFKPHPTAFLGYLISHESHHRGQIMLCLKQSGHPADRMIQFGLWEWGSR